MEKCVIEIYLDGQCRDRLPEPPEVIRGDSGRKEDGRESRTRPGIGLALRAFQVDSNFARRRKPHGCWVALHIIRRIPVHHKELHPALNRHFPALRLVICSYARTQRRHLAARPLRFARNHEYICPAG